MRTHRLLVRAHHALPTHRRVTRESTRPRVEIECARGARAKARGNHRPSPGEEERDRESEKGDREHGCGQGRGLRENAKGRAKRGKGERNGDGEGKQGTITYDMIKTTNAEAGGGCCGRRPTMRTTSVRRGAEKSCRAGC